MAEEKKKGLIGKALDALSGKDAPVEDKQAEAHAAAAAATAKKAQEEKVAAEKRAAEAEAKLKALEAQKARQVVSEQEKARQAAFAAGMARKAAEAAAPKIMKTHKIEPGETLSHLAQHFYGHATPQYWQLIIDANKAKFGTEVKNYKPGITIDIPELPDNLK